MVRTKKTSFAFTAPQAVHDVKLCGTFTNWEQGAIVMSRDGKTGSWKAQVILEPGEYEYKFWADGIWYNDPQADKLSANVWGSENSVRIVK